MGGMLRAKLRLGPISQGRLGRKRDRSRSGDYDKTMVTLRDLHRYQNDRAMVQLKDGRIGKIVRVDTTFPGNYTEVSVYTLGKGRKATEPGAEGADARRASEGRCGPGIARVSLERIAGLAKVG